MVKFKPTLKKTTISLLTGLAVSIIVFFKFTHLVIEQTVSGFIFYSSLVYLIWSLFQKDETEEIKIKKRSKLAITSFIISFIGFYPLFSFFPISIPGFSILLLGVLLLTPILSRIGFTTAIISLRLIKKYDLKGKEFAITSIIFSSIGLIFIIYFILNPPGPIF